MRIYLSHSVDTVLTFSLRSSDQMRDNIFHECLKSRRFCTAIYDANIMTPVWAVKYSAKLKAFSTCDNSLMYLTTTRALHTDRINQHPSEGGYYIKHCSCLKLCLSQSSFFIPAQILPLKGGLNQYGEMIFSEFSNNLTVKMRCAQKIWVFFHLLFRTHWCNDSGKL